MNPWGAPDRIRAMHLANQRADVNGDRRSTEPGLRGTPAPMRGEQAAMPGDNGGGFHDLHRLPPAGPDSGEQHPQQSVSLAKPKPSRRGLLKYGELVAKGYDLRFEFDSSSEVGPNRCKEGRDARAHDW